MGAIYALQHRHAVVAIVCGFLCALASPLAGCFLALVAAAWAVSSRERRVWALALGFATLVPVGTIALVFPTAGAEPYES